ncbi:MAG: LPS-assembly protein LptD [Alphaproteobacteria bacterium]|nr:LPS-assembly protein LptD [Alphaproteobacteria bacterium]
MPTTAFFRLALLLLAFLALGVTYPVMGAEKASAPKSAEEEQVFFSADEVNQDKDLGVMTARGHVEVSYQGRVLLADQISYNTRQDIITASGSVSLLEPSGDVFFADYFELSGDLKEATSRNLRILMANRTRLAAAKSVRIAGEKNVMEKAVYSACEQCKDDPKKPPLWQVKAMRVTNDEKKQTFEYRDAWVEFAGVPVIYTPYFQHADPRVPRHSGFLPPSFGGSSQLGGAITVPYYWAISNNQDATISTMATGKENVVLVGEHRNRLANGKTDTEGSFNFDSKSQFRGHIRAKGLFDIDETWRAGYQLDRASDDTYLRRYGFKSDRWLETHPYVEGFAGRSHARMESYLYQGLSAKDDPGKAPVVLPLAEYNYIGQPGAQGQYWSFDAGALDIYRGEGTDTRRLSSRLGWTLPYTAPAGDIYTLSASLRGEGYHISDYQTNTRTEKGFSGRAVPQLSLDWRYPFVRNGERFTDVVEPIVVGTVSPNGMNPTRIPNEDSLDFEYDDTNLFSPQRFTGLDRVEGGPRVAYGVKWSVFGNKPGAMTALLGQSYRAHVDETYAADSGLKDNLSDYVGRISINPVGNFMMLYRFRFDKDTLASKRSEVGARIGPKALNVRANYVFVDQNSISGYPDREQINVSASSMLTRYWSAQAGTVYNLGEKYEPISFNTGLVYEDECFALSANYVRKFTYDRDYVGGQYVLFRFTLKTLGEFQATAE